MISVLSQVDKINSHVHLSNNWDLFQNKDNDGIVRKQNDYVDGLKTVLIDREREELPEQTILTSK